MTSTSAIRWASSEQLLINNLKTYSFHQADLSCSHLKDQNAVFCLGILKKEEI